MKINLNNFPFEYGAEVSNPIAEEGSRSFTLDNRSKYFIKKWSIDKIIFNDSI